MESLATVFMTSLRQKSNVPPGQTGLQLQALGKGGQGKMQCRFRSGLCRTTGFLFLVVVMASLNTAPAAAASIVTKIAQGEWEKCEEPDLPPDKIISYCDAMLSMGIGNGLSGRYRYPSLAEANHALHAGLAFLRKGQANFARQYFEFSIASVTRELNKFQGPDFSGQRCWILTVLNAQLDTAMADCEQGLKKKPNDPDLLRNKGFVLFRLGKYQEALTLLDASLQSGRGDGLALFLRGAVKQKLGDGTGEADIKAAKTWNSKIDAVFRNYGVSLN